MKNKKKVHVNDEEKEDIGKEEVEVSHISEEDQIEVFSEIIIDIYLEALCNKNTNYEKRTGSTS